MMGPLLLAGAFLTLSAAARAALALGRWAWPLAAFLAGGAFAGLPRAACSTRPFAGFFAFADRAIAPPVGSKLVPVFKVPLDQVKPWVLPCNRTFRVPINRAKTGWEKRAPPILGSIFLECPFTGYSPARAKLRIGGHGVSAGSLGDGPARALPASARTSFNLPGAATDALPLARERRPSPWRLLRCTSFPTVARLFPAGGSRASS